jgi:hypothetical protein
MSSSRTRRLRRLAAGLAITGALAGVTAGSAAAAYDPGDPAQKAQYDQALSLGTQGYVYGIPLLNMEKTFQSTTSVNVCDEQGNGPVNVLCPVRQLLDASFRTVVAPNQDTLYTNAWLDLKSDAMVIHVPQSGGRLNVVPLLDPYEENFGSIGEGASGLLPPGDYVITGPNFNEPGRIPAGLTRIRASYNRAWIIMRTYIDNHDAADYAPVHALQDATKIVPLAKWVSVGPGYAPNPPKTPDTTVNAATIPGTQPGDDPLAFFDALNAEMKQFQPTAADQPLIDQLATVGIAPGGKPVTTSGKLSDATLAGLRDSVAAGKAKVNATLTQLFQAGFAAHNGWLVAPTGNYGTDYNFRAVVDQIGLGALPKNVAIYPVAQTDRTGVPLSGSKRYVLHFNGPSNPLLPQLPIPANAFWSVTLYDQAGFFVDNVDNRYVVNDRTDLTYNADGSLDIYVQPNPPSDAAQRKNWLPSPAGAPFRMLSRLYGPPADKIAGIIDGSAWKDGTVLPCTPAGTTPAFPPGGIAAPISCAS